MPKYIVAVRMSGGTEHRHIAGCAIVDTDGAIAAYAMTRARVVADIDAGGEYITRDWEGDVADVVVVKNRAGQRYLRSRADRDLGDNLLRLPRYLGQDVDP